MPKARPNIKRLNLELQEPIYDRLKVVEELTGAATTTEVIRRALAVYDYLVHARKRGERLVVKKGSNETEIILIQ